MKYTIGHMRQFTSIGLIVTCLLSSVSVLGTNLTGKRIYINPGHGSWGSDDRPLATIPYPNLPTSGMPDTLGFYESNTNLWKCMYLGQKLEAAGATVFYSRTANGPWDYEMVDGDYPTYNAANYLNRSDYHKYNKNLTEISAEVEANNIDYFISVHSNATGIKDGDLRNHPLYIYRGPNDYANANTTNNYEYVPGSYEKAAVSWDYCNEIMLSGINPSTDFKTTKYIAGDQDFYSEPYDSHNQHSWKTYYGYLGALKHGASGFLVEGYFHSYQPARHRALNPDYCAMEGLAYYRGIVDYYDADIETKGYIMGTIKDANNKIEHSLFKYLQGTNDQWLPCNGATVTLYKAGVAIQTYKVDTLYNGIFVFKDLEPGDDYSLDATCPGYAPLANTYKSTFSVKANQTTYQMIYLEETAQPTSVPSIFGMKQSYTNQSVSDLLSNKTIRRTIYGDGMIYILAVDANKQPTLLAVNTDTQNATTLPTNLCTVTSNNGYKLSDIALTEDGVLIGCNMENVKSSPTNNWTLYKWIKTASGWQQEIWFSHAIAATAGNWESAMTGGSIAYKGSTKHGRLITTAISTYTPYKIRMAIYDIAGGQVHKVWYNKFSDETNTNTNTYGEALQLDVSPRERDTYIFSSPKKNAFEWQINTTSAGTITTTATMPFHTYNASYFTYANKEMMAIADTDPQGKNIGIKLYDISTISNTTIQPILVKTTNTTLNATTPVYVSSMGYAYNKDITLYLLKDNTLSKFTTVNVEQPKIPHIGAYNLNTINQGGNYTFSFYANDNTEDASLIFYDVATGVEVERQPIRVQKGANTYTLAAEDLPGQNGDTFTWAIELNGLAVKDFGLLHTDESLIASPSSRLFNAVNTNPESEKFGYIYVMHQATYTGDDRKNSGVWEYDYTLSKQHDTRYNGNQIFGSPYRMSIDKEGYLYLTDWSDGAHSGIWIANTADLTQPFTPFFVGEHDSNGVIQNNGQCIGSSTSGCFVYGEGKDTKLYVYNEDEKNTLYANSIAIYHIGQEDGTLLHEWNTTPNPTYLLENQSGSNANVWVTSKGFFICQVRETGMNNSTAPSLQFYSYDDGRCRLSSDSENYAKIIDGSYAGGFAVSLDEKMLILNDGSQNFLLFNITWSDNTPTLELQTKFHHGISAIRQMNWDYAGNLICSGDEGIHIFTVPTNKNQIIIPARKALTVTHQTGFTYVTSITLNSDRSLIKIGSKDTLTAVVSPAHATNQSIVWESKDNAIATVDNGIVTGVAKGETTIYAKTNDGSNLVDSCYVRVYGYMDEADACRIWAYDLNLSNEGNAYTFEFKSTTYAIAAYLIFLDEEEKEISRYALNRVEKGLNTFTLDIHDIVQTDNVIRWAVELHSEPIQDIVEITSNEDKYYYYLAQDVAVNTNPYSKHFGKMYVLETYAGAGDGISAHSQTQTPGIYVYDPALNLENYAEGYLPSNVTLNTAAAGKLYRELHRMAINPVKEELAFVQSTAVKVWVASLDNLEAEATNVLAETGIKASSLCYDENGTLYVLDPFAATATIYKQVDGEFVKFVERNNWGWTDDRNAMESDGRGGLWVVQNISDLATNGYSEDMLTHINAAGEVDFYVNKTSSAELQALMPAASNRGQIGYDAKHDVLALGGSGTVRLFHVTYTEDGPTLSLWKTVTLDGNNVDGLAFDYAGDLIAMSASVERFYKFALPTAENTCTTPAPKAQVVVKEVPTPTYTVTVSAENGSVGGLENEGVYEDGASVTLTATAAEGYEFVNWTVGGEEVSTENPYTFVVSADVAVVANFVAVDYKDITFTVGKSGFTGVPQIKWWGAKGLEDAAEPVEMTAGQYSRYSYTFSNIDAITGVSFYIVLDGVQSKTITLHETPNTYSQFYTILQEVFVTLDGEIEGVQLEGHPMAGYSSDYTKVNGVVQLPANTTKAFKLTVDGKDKGGNTIALTKDNLTANFTEDGEGNATIATELAGGYLFTYDYITKDVTVVYPFVGTMDLGQMTPSYSDESVTLRDENYNEVTIYNVVEGEHTFGDNFDIEASVKHNGEWYTLRGKGSWTLADGVMTLVATNLVDENNTVNYTITATALAPQEYTIACNGTYDEEVTEYYSSIKYAATTDEEDVIVIEIGVYGEETSASGQFNDTYFTTLTYTVAEGEDGVKVLTATATDAAGNTYHITITATKLVYPSVNIYGATATLNEEEGALTLSGEYEGQTINCEIWGYIGAGDYEYVGILAADYSFEWGADIATVTEDGDQYTITGVFMDYTSEEKYEVMITTAKNPATALENVTSTVAPVKAIVNGQLVIVKDGVQYNAQGAVVK